MVDTLTTEEIVEQLCVIYYKYETWHKTVMSIEQARHYHKTMLERGNILIYEENRIVVGYIEILCINFEQFGRIVCTDSFCSTEENTTDGNIAYVNNMVILPERRNSSIIKYLRNMSFKKFFKCEYFCGTRVTKSTSKKIKIHKRSELSSKNA